jgi:inositol oxygenase
MAMVRLHSLYPWHTGGAYRQFMCPEDQAMMDW